MNIFLNFIASSENPFIFQNLNLARKAISEDGRKVSGNRPLRSFEKLPRISRRSDLTSLAGL